MVALCLAPAVLDSLASADSSPPNRDAQQTGGSAELSDSAALLGSAEVSARAGRLEEAVGLLEKVVWLADQDPESALDALLVLRELAPSWRRIRIVPVHVYANADVRSRDAWIEAVRSQWLDASNSLNEVLQTRFVPIHIGAFDPKASPLDLNATYAEFVRRVKLPEQGIAALMIGGSLPSRPGQYETGVAELLGRTLVARIGPAGSSFTVLGHELLHLYGALHVPDEIESLMNRSAESAKLDPASARLARAFVERSFGSGGVAKNVLSHVDLRQATAAFVEVLETNRSVRHARSRSSERLGSWTQSMMDAWRDTSLDSHYADASRIVAVLMLADSRRAEALKMLDLAIELYASPDSARGRETALAAALLREEISRAKLAAAHR